jgi:hypothetical protein
MMRPVLARVATLAEIHDRWSLLDVLDVNEALDLMDEAELRAQRQALGGRGPR